MKKLILAILLIASIAAFAQTTTFTANLKDLATNTPSSPEAGPVYIELTLKNCAGSGTNPTIPHVNGVGALTFPVNLYPTAGVVSATVYDETFIVCGSSAGVGYYHVRIYQGDNTRSLVKKLVFEDDFDIQGASFTLNSATPRSGAVITPPPATAVLTNPVGNQTVVQPVSTALTINRLSAGFAQSANGTDMIPGNRFTDTSPTGNFFNFKNAALSTSLWQVDVTGSLLAGIIPAARVSSGTVAIANGGTGQSTASAAFNALSPLTTLGDVIYASGVNTAARLAGNITSAKQYLSQTGTGAVSAAPAWAQVNFTDLAGVGSCAQEPALTGDTTTSAGSCATTVAKIQGTTVTGTTGTVAAVLSTSPTLVTPNIGVATATSVNKVAITAPATSATLTIANSKTLTANNTLTLAGTDGTTLTGPATTPTGGVLAFGVPSKQIFTASGTFTIPTGVTAVKVTLIGGGGAGGGATATNNGGGGGSGGAAIKWLSGLTPANTITVTVGAGGTGVSAAAGNAGTASSIASGTQTITTVTANAGGGGNSNAAQSAGGLAGTISTNGDVNLTGNPGNGDWSTISGAAGGGSIFGGGGNDSNGGNAGNAAGSVGGGGGGAGAGANRAGGAGAAGIVIFEWVT